MLLQYHGILEYLLEYCTVTTGIAYLYCNILCVVYPWYRNIALATSHHPFLVFPYSSTLCTGMDYRYLLRVHVYSSGDSFAKLALAGGMGIGTQCINKNMA